MRSPVSSPVKTSFKYMVRVLVAVAIGSALWLNGFLVAIHRVELMPPPPAPVVVAGPAPVSKADPTITVVNGVYSPTLTLNSGTYTEAEFVERARGSIARYGFGAVCIGHVQHLVQTTLPARDFDRDAYVALAFYAYACAELKGE